MDRSAAINDFYDAHRKASLKTADKPDSQDLCLIEAHGTMRSFLDKSYNFV